MSPFSFHGNMEMFFFFLQTIESVDEPIYVPSTSTYAEFTPTALGVSYISIKISKSALVAFFLLFLLALVIFSFACSNRCKIDQLFKRIHREDELSLSSAIENNKKMIGPDEEEEFVESTLLCAVVMPSD